MSVDWQNQIKIIQITPTSTKANQTKINDIKPDSTIPNQTNIQVFLAFYLNLKFLKSMLVLRNSCTVQTCTYWNQYDFYYF